MYNDPAFNEILPFMMLFFGIYGLLIIGALVSYIMRGFGIMQLSRTLGLSNGWLGFIPIGRDYQLGRMAGDIELGSRRVTNPGLWMALLPVVVNGIFSVIYSGMIFGTFATLIGEASDSFYYHDYYEDRMLPGMTRFLAGFIFLFLFVYAGSIFINLFRLMVMGRVYGYFYTGQRPLFYLVLSAFVPFAAAVLMMKTSKQPVINPPAYAYRNPYYPAQPYGPTPYGPPPQYPPYGPQPYAQQSPPPPYPPYGQPQGQQPYPPQPDQSPPAGSQPYGRQPVEPQPYPQQPPQAQYPQQGYEPPAQTPTPAPPTPPPEAAAQPQEFAAPMQESPVPTQEPAVPPQDLPTPVEPVDTPPVPGSSEANSEEDGLS